MVISPVEASAGDFLMLELAQFRPTGLLRKQTGRSRQGLQKQRTGVPSDRIIHKDDQYYIEMS